MAEVDDWKTVGRTPPAPQDDWRLVGPQEPEAPPAAFLDRLANGEKVKEAFDKETAKSYSQRIKEWGAQELKAGDYLGAGVATIGATLMGIPEGIADMMQFPKDYLDGKVPDDQFTGRSLNFALNVVGGTEFAKPLIKTSDGQIARPYTKPDGTAATQIVGAMPHELDFKAGGEALGGAAEENLKRLWTEQGIHPAEAAHDAQRDAFLKHDLVQKGEEVKPSKDMIENWPEPVPTSLGAAVNDLPKDIPISEQPASPPGRLSASIQSAADKLYDIGRDAQMLVAPMATGTRDSIAIAKDFANTMRRNRWDWSRIDDDIAQRFTPEQRTRMWNAADEESVMRQSGETSEHMGLMTLAPEERAAVEELQSRAQNAWLRAGDLGMVEGEGLPAYTPRMVVNAAGAVSGDKPIALNGIGHNLRISTPGMKHRKYLTAEETEAAAKEALGEGAEIARDIRTLPLATAKLEDAIAGRQLIDLIKDYGKRTGVDTVVEGAIPAGSETKWFTLDHPAFKTWRPKHETNPDGTLAVEGNRLKVAKDANGNDLFEQVPLYVHGDFEGPLKAVLSQNNGALYSAAIELKAKTMSLIMNSPMIHNLVEWGRAFPAMPGKVLTGRVYFQGNRFKNDIAGMQEAIQNGMVPIGGRFFKHSIDDIVKDPDLTPGTSLTAKLAAFVPGLFDEAAGVAVKRAIDKAGNFWHNTLLWDRIGDLQAGLYVNFRDEAIARGIDRTTASRVAAHWANRFAGALPEEAMSSMARKTANVLMFSRSFTLGNLGVMKDMFTGLPKDVMAQIERDMGTIDPKAAGYAKSIARRQAWATVVIDMAFALAGYSILQNAVNILAGDSTLEKEVHGYAKRFGEALHERQMHPMKAIQVFDFLHHVSASGENEPGRQDRLLVGHDKDGTGIYARVPPGKMGEEFEGWMTGPLDMMRRKLSPAARFGWDVLANDKGFGRKLYDPTADSVQGYVSNLGKIAFHLMEVHAPSGQIEATRDLIRGDGDAKVNSAKAFLPFLGITTSKGAPGGPAIGELYHARQQHDFAVQSQLPDIQKQFLRGDRPGAQERMTELGVPAGLQRYYFRVWQNPATRLSPKALRDFYLYATPAQRDRLENFRGQ